MRNYRQSDVEVIHCGIKKIQSEQVVMGADGLVHSHNYGDRSKIVINAQSV